ncbi:MAG TPA: amidohydrolase family protein [Bryobacteraceae bacterium]|nr:amidohydrolase family protein [Bryobacteraceae bacterium]
MRFRCLAPLGAALLTLAACSRAPLPLADAGLAAEIAGIRAIDNHAHPVRVTAAGEQPDRDFDALPVDNMEPQSDPIGLRPGAPGVLDAWHALYGFNGPDLNGGRLAPAQALKQRVQHEKGEQYPAWVLDEMGVAVMLANRVSMGPSIQPPRFRWVPYADALIFPLDNSRLAAANSDRKSFFALEDILRRKYLDAVGLQAPPFSLADYLRLVVTPTLERQRAGGAVAEKFESAYLRSLEFDQVNRAAADRIYTQFAGKGAPSEAEYKPLQDFLFRYIAAECGRLGMAVHIHTNAGAGGYFDVAGVNPLLLESVLNAPELRQTKFVMLHGGWPFTREIGALLTKPNAYLDFSAQAFLASPQTMAGWIREWLELVPEKVMFATDAYPYSPEMGWEESGVIAANRNRQALAITLTEMMRAGEISRARASELARMVLRDNARALYGLPDAP